MPACAVRRAGGAPRKGFSSSSAGPTCGRGTSRVENLFTGFPALSRNSIVPSPCGRFFRKNCTTAPPGGFSPAPAPPPPRPPRPPPPKRYVSLGWNSLTSSVAWKGTVAADEALGNMAIGGSIAPTATDSYTAVFYAGDENTGCGNVSGYQ